MIKLREKPDQIKDVFLRIKSLQQCIHPITIGAGASRPYIWIKFDKEAAKQFSRSTLVYLSWEHSDRNNTRGYNVFTQESKDPNIWRIHLPASMLHEGKVLARIELVDKFSIAASTNFEINILYNPNQDETFTESEDFGVFQQAIVDLTGKIDDTRQMLEDTRDTVEDLSELFEQAKEFYKKMEEEFEQRDQKIDDALQTSYNAMCVAMKALNQLMWGTV